MLTVHTAADLRNQLRQWREAGERIACVPTMGNLHAGHLALVRRAQDRAERVVVTVFVNPLQFGPGEDYTRYPRTLEADQVQLAVVETDLLFAPSVEEMYPGGLEHAVCVQVPALDAILEGKFRPGHFTGVATVVARLFNLVQPDVAVFGEKDYQQLAVIRRMVRELAFPIEIVGVPTVRETDGLAMSSRNQYLSAEERARAPQLYAVLRELCAALVAGRRDFEALQREAMDKLAREGFRPEYVEVRTPETLAAPRPEAAQFVVLAAAWLGRARLIDNLEVLVRAGAGCGAG